MPSLLKTSLTGDVTALHFRTLGPGVNHTVLFAGCGPQLLVYRLCGGDLLAVHRVLDGCRIHGIATAMDTLSGPGDRFSCWVVVYGDRWVQVLRLQLPPDPRSSPDGGSEAGIAAAASLVPAVRLPARPAWVLAAHLQPVPCGPPDPAHVAQPLQHQPSPQHATTFQGSAEQRPARPARSPQSAVAAAPAEAPPAGFTLSTPPPSAPPALLLVLALADNTAEVWRLRPPPPDRCSSSQPQEAPSPVSMGSHQRQQQDDVRSPQPQDAPPGTSQPPPPRPAAAAPLLEAAWLVAAGCGRRGQLFSAAVAAMRVPATGELRLWLAAGTMFNEVHLWRLPLLPPWRHGRQQGGPTLVACGAAPGDACTGDAEDAGNAVSGGGAGGVDDGSSTARDVRSAPAPASSAPAGGDGRSRGWPYNVPAPAERVRHLAARYDSLEARLGRLEAAASWTLTSTSTAARAQQGLAQAPTHARTGAHATQTAQLHAGRGGGGGGRDTGAVQCCAAGAGAGSGAGGPLRVCCPVRHVLRGHEGSVFHVEWLPPPPPPPPGRSAGSGGEAGHASAGAGWMLATASDDRSARVWDLPDLDLDLDLDLGPGWSEASTGSGGPAAAAAGCLPAPVLSPLRTLWGHTSRVWCCAALPAAGLVPGVGVGGDAGSLGPGRAAASSAEGEAALTDSRGGGGGGAGGRSGKGEVPPPPPLVLVTGSEDCSARLWDVSSGRCLAALQGHRGRGIWRCAVLAPEGLLATAGADGVIRLWALREWATASAAAAGLHGLLPRGSSGAGAGGEAEAARRADGAAGGAATTRPEPVAAAGSGVTTQTMRFALPPAGHSTAPRSGSGGPGSGSGGGGEGVRCLALQPGGDVLFAGGYSGGVHRISLAPTPPSPSAPLQPGVGGLRGPPQPARAEAQPAGAQVAIDGVLERGGPLPGDGASGGGGGGWERLYGDATAGAVTCLEVCAWPWPPEGGRRHSGRRNDMAGTDGGTGTGSAVSSGAPVMVAVGHNSGLVSVLSVLPAGTVPPHAEQDGPRGLETGEDAGGSEAADCCESGDGGANRCGGSPANGGSGGGGSTAAVVCRWRATGTGAVIGAWWAPALGPRLLLTVGGDAPEVKLWRLPLPATPAAGAAGAAAGAAPRDGSLTPFSCGLPVTQQPQPPQPVPPPTAELVGVARSPLRGRLLVADVCPRQRVMLAGDQHGNLLAFDLPEPFWEAISPPAPPAASAGEPAAASAGEPAAATDGAGIGGSDVSGSLAEGAAPPTPAPPESAPPPACDLPCVAVARGALGPAAASWVRAQPAAGGGVFIVAGRDGLMARYRYRYRRAPDAAAQASRAVPAEASVVPVAAPAEAGQHDAPLEAAAPGRPGCSDVVGGAADAAAAARGGSTAGSAAVLECLSSSSRSGVASIELVTDWAPPPPRQLPPPPPPPPRHQASRVDPPRLWSSDPQQEPQERGLGAGFSVNPLTVASALPAVRHRISSTAGATDDAGESGVGAVGSSISISSVGGTGGGGCTLVGGFRGSELLLLSLNPDPTQLMRVGGCGGWRRTHALQVGGPDHVTFAHVACGGATGRGGGGDAGATGATGIQVVARRPAATLARRAVMSAAAAAAASEPVGLPEGAGAPDAAAAAAAVTPTPTPAPGCGTALSAGAVPRIPRSLHCGHHGREVLCACVLPGPLPHPHAPAVQPAEGFRPTAVVAGGASGDHDDKSRDWSVGAADGAATAGPAEAPCHQAQAPPPPPPPQLPPLVVLTGAEDGSIRRVTARAASLGLGAPAANSGSGAAACYGPCFEDGAVVGEHAAGTAVRCLSAVPLRPSEAALFEDYGGDGDAAAAAVPVTGKAECSGVIHNCGGNGEDGVGSGPACVLRPGQNRQQRTVYLVMSAGVKEVLMAWLVCLEAPAPPPTSGQHASIERPVSPVTGCGVVPGPSHGSGSSSSDVSGGIGGGGGAAHSTRSIPPADGPLRGARPQAAPPLDVSSRWLSTRPPRQGLRPRSLRVAQPVPSGDRRYLALALLGVATPPPPPPSPPLSDAALPPPPMTTTTTPPTTTEPVASAAAATALLAVSASDATTSLLTWGLTCRSWRHAARLEWHQHPVLSLAHLPQGPRCSPMDANVNAAEGAGARADGGGDEGDCGGSGRGGAAGGGGEGGSGYWLATGDTAGDVALWWVPAWLHGAAGAADAGDGRRGGGGGGDGGRGDGGGGATAGPSLRPVLVVRRVHQSGVNALALARWAPAGDPLARRDADSSPGSAGSAGFHSSGVATAPDRAGGGGSLVLVSGGDDQALAVLHFRLRARPFAPPPAFLEQHPTNQQSASSSTATERGERVCAASQAPADAAGSAEGPDAGGWSVRLAGATVRPLAHASALRGVALECGGAAGPADPVTVLAPGGPAGLQGAADAALAAAAGDHGGGGGGGGDGFGEASRRAGPVARACSVGLDQAMRLWRLQRCGAATKAAAELVCQPERLQEDNADGRLPSCASPGNMGGPPSPASAAVSAAREANCTYSAAGVQSPPSPPTCCLRIERRATTGSGGATTGNVVELELVRSTEPAGGSQRVATAAAAATSRDGGGAGVVGAYAAWVGAVPCSGGKGSDVGGCLICGEEPLSLLPLAACALDVPEPACVAAVALPTPVPTLSSPRGVVATPAVVGVHHQGMRQQHAGGRREAAPDGAGMARMAAAVAGRGLQLVECSW